MTTLVSGKIHILDQLDEKRGSCNKRSSDLLDMNKKPTKPVKITKLLNVFDSKKSNVSQNSMLLNVISKQCIASVSSNNSVKPVNEFFGNDMSQDLDQKGSADSNSPFEENGANGNNKNVKSLLKRLNIIKTKNIGGFELAKCFGELKDNPKKYIPAKRLKTSKSV